MKKWGSLYGEFKINKGFISSQYYSLYFLRRFAYLLSQVYLCNTPHLQEIFNIVGSIIMTSYVIYYRPFKDNWILLSNICGELSIILTIIFSYVFLFDVSINAQNFLEVAIMFTILAGMASQFLVSLFLFGKSMHIVWKKAQKLRAETFLGNSTVRKTSNTSETNLR